MELGLVLGARCNASCGHCSKSYGPYRSEELGRDEIVRLMDEAAALREGEPLLFLLTGGEPFLDFPKLLAVVAHGAGLGAKVACVTNGYWAKDEQVAARLLQQLKEAGLTALAVSASRFHQDFIPLERVQRALSAASAAGLITELKGAVINEDLAPGGLLDLWRETLSADAVCIFPIFPSLREGFGLPAENFYRLPGLPTEPCPAELLTIGSDGVAASCCGPGAPDEFLSLGDTRTSKLADLVGFLRRSKRHRILREIGPIHFARAAQARGFGDRLHDAYAGPCDLCWHIRSDSQLRAVAEAIASTTTNKENFHEEEKEGNPEGLGAAAGQVSERQ